jgi:hypothetical protein
MAMSSSFLDALREFVANSAGEVQQAAQADLERLEDAEKGPLNEFEDAVFAAIQGLYLNSPSGGVASHEAGGNVVAGVPQPAKEGDEIYVSPVAAAAGVAPQQVGQPTTGQAPQAVEDEDGNPVVQPLEATENQTARPQANVPGVDEGGAALRDEDGNVTGTGPAPEVKSDSGKSSSSSSKSSKK